MFEDSMAPRTQYDLNFRVGDIPVRVHPYFWLSTVLLGLGSTDRSVKEIVIHLLAWMAVVFISVLVHELGHVLMGRYFGCRGHIILTGFCGLAVGSSNQSRRWQRIAVYLAGPGAGFLLAGLVLGTCWIYNPGYMLYELRQVFHVEGFVPDLVRPSEIVQFIVLNMLWFNIFWGLVNLLPIWPLDGGQVSREICESYRPRRGLLISAQISLFTAMGFAALALIEMVTKKPLIPYIPFGGGLFPVIFFGLLAYNSWQLLQFVKRAGPDWDEREKEPLEPWQQDADWWKRGDDRRH
jgi:stage IV sporulation protein FB